MEAWNILFSLSLCILFSKEDFAQMEQSVFWESRRILLGSLKDLVEGTVIKKLSPNEEPKVFYLLFPGSFLLLSPPTILHVFNPTISPSTRIFKKHAHRRQKGFVLQGNLNILGFHQAQKGLLAVWKCADPGKEKKSSDQWGVIPDRFAKTSTMFSGKGIWLSL